MDYHIRKSGDIKNIRLPIKSFKENNKTIKRDESMDSKSLNLNEEKKSKLSELENKKIRKRQIDEKSLNAHSRKRVLDGKTEIRVKKQKKKKIYIIRKIFVLICTIIILGISFGMGMLKGILTNTPEISSFHFGPTNFATKIYDTNGDLMETLVMEGSNRDPVKYADIPDSLINAFVAIEDQDFWNHSGVSLKSIFRAVYGIVLSNSNLGGGSTITQQLIKNALFNVGMHEKGFETYTRKLQEQYIALLYESQTSMSKREIKEQIITDYLNIINLGSNTLGVKVASKRYFDKDVKDLTISESAVIASITKNPSRYNPVNHPENNRARQVQVLKNMKNLQYITDEEYNEALNDDVYSRIKNIDIKQDEVRTAYSYFTDALISQVEKDLSEKLGNSLLATNMLYSGGLKIYSTQNPELQKVVDKEINDDKNYTVKKYSMDYRLTISHENNTVTNYSQYDVDKYEKEVIKNTKYTGLFLNTASIDTEINKFKNYVMKDGDIVQAESLNYVLEPQCSFVLIDHKNGQVVALSGGRGEKTMSRSLNRATATLRQPGSTFKVLSSFAPALQLFQKSLASTYYDGEYVYKDKTFKNWYSKGYLGYQNIRSGIIYSLNIIAIRCLMETVSPELGVNFAEKLGITTLVKEGKINDIGPATALGGLTGGVTNIDLTSAFATIANQGEYIKPILYTRIEDHNGNVIIDNSKIKPSRVLSKENSYLLTDAMSASMKSNRAYSGSITVNSTSVRAHLKNMSAAGKSGTTTDNVDIWFIGYTPYYTAGIWGGCDENQSLQNTAKKINNGGTNYHKDIWKKIMETIHQGKEDIGFTKPPSIITKEVCRKSGLLATDLCKKDPRGSCAYEEMFIDGTQPRQRCNMHVQEGLMKLPDKYKDLESDDTPYEISRFINEEEVVPIISDDDKQNVIIAGGNVDEIENLGPVVIPIIR